MTTATMKIEFDSGSIEESFKEAIRISEILNVFIEFDFNGVLCTAMPNGDIDYAVIKYREIVGDDNVRVKTVMAVPKTT